MTYADEKPLNVEGPKFKHDRTTIIIPCYNEEDRLHLEVFLNFSRKHPNISFVFVDDGSKDERNIRVLSRKIRSSLLMMAPKI